MAPLKIPLQVICPNCQLGNLPGSPYCSGCGAPLGGALTSPGQSSTTKSGPITESNLNRFSTGDLLSADSILLKKLCSDGQDSTLAKQAYERASQILVGGEEIKYIAIANKPMVGSIPDCVVATSKRVLVYKKKLLGKLEQDDCYWRDLNDAQLKEGRSGITLALTTIQGWRLTVEGLPKAQARGVYELAIDNCERLQEKLRQEALATNAVSTPVQAPPALVQLSSIQQPQPQPQAAIAPQPTAPAQRAPRPVAQQAQQLPAHPMQPAPQPPTYQQPTAQAAPVPSQQAPMSAASAPLTAALKRASGPLTPVPVQGPGSLFKAASEPLPRQASGPLPATPATPVAQPAPQPQPVETFTPESVLESLLSAAHTQAAPSPQQPTAQAAAFQAAPTQYDAQPLVFEEQTSPQLPALADTSAPRSDPKPEIMPHYSNGVRNSGPLPQPAWPQSPAQVARPGEPLPGEAQSPSGLPDSEPPAVPMPNGNGSEGADTGSLSTRLLQYSPEAESAVAGDSLYGYGVSGPLNGSTPTTPILPSLSQPRAPRSKSPSGSTRSSQSKQGVEDPVLKMKQLKEMLDNGFITREDYELKKAEILGRI